MRGMNTRHSVLALSLILVLAGLAAGPAGQTPSSSVVVVTIDGLRWQEMFTGASLDYFKKNDKGEVDPASHKYGGATPEARRAIVMPFMWNVIAAHGQIFGDPSQG